MTVLRTDTIMKNGIRPIGRAIENKAQSPLAYERW